MSTQQDRQQSVTATEETEKSLLEELLSETNIAPSEDAYNIARQGVSAFVSELLRGKTTKIDKSAVDAMIAEIDARLSAQVNAILHHEAVQKLESAWRGLKWLVDQVDFRENIKIEVLNCSKDDLIEDFEDAPEVVKSGLYRTVYSGEYGTFGGKPYGLICANYEFGPGAEDVELLTKCAAVAAMSHAPFISNAAPKMFGVKSFEELPRLKDLKSLFEGPQYARWQSLRASEDARYLGLCAPRFMLRAPYGEESRVRSFDFTEDVRDHDSYLWGPSSIAMASRVAESFASFRWCPNIIGPQSGGTVEALPVHHYKAMGEVQTKSAVEVQLTERREYELAEEGFIGLTMRKDSDNAAFFSANSVQKPKIFPNNEEGRKAEVNYRLGTQLPYIFITTRIAHYLKVLQREQIGTWKERSDLERELNQWLGRYVSDMDSPAPGVRARKPLRKAKIIVEDVENQPGWYRCSLQLQPHFKYMGASFTLSLVGKLDKE
ncbi:MAG: type VI secretion system contractile sheath large subunit [Myxococcales bacterium]|nr:type VI secretion system contractile sheath large subunit [Myxococcales bacterium]